MMEYGRFPAGNTPRKEEKKPTMTFAKFIAAVAFAALALGLGACASKAQPAPAPSTIGLSK